MKILPTLTAAALTLSATLSAFAGEAVNTDKTGVAIGGYDPVAYFESDDAERGNFQIAAEHGDATYWFTSEENKALFEADPKAYLPQYGGYCAFGAALGRKFSADPETFVIEDGKLYLNLNEDIAETFNDDLDAQIQKADQHWPEIKDVPAEDLG